MVFNQNYTLGLIKEVGEDTVLLSVDDKDIVVPLHEKNRIAVFEAVEEGIYLVPYDKENNELLMTVDEKILYEVFPEMELDELKGATEDIPEDE